jgi:hypothetical protein
MLQNPSGENTAVAAAREHYYILLERIVLQIMASTSPPSKACEPIGSR